MAPSARMGDSSALGRGRQAAVRSMPTPRSHGLCGAVLWDGQGVPVQAGQVLTPGEGAERFLHHTLEPIQVAYREEFLKK